MALLINRRGEIAYVIVGDYKHIVIPELDRYRLGSGRLMGLRCIHTHLNGEPLSNEDITDLLLLGMDLMVCIQVDETGIPGPISYAHILPVDRNDQGWEISQVPDIGQLNIDFLKLIQALEDEINRRKGPTRIDPSQRAVLVGVGTDPLPHIRESLDELKDLAESNGLEVVEIVIQRIKKADPRFLMGKGKLSQLVLRCLQTGSNLLIFDHELTPAQVKSLTDFTELRIIDRSQLILDIFARRAVTREGKIQVEQAQLKYLLPRLATKNTAMSRLTGGIGGRGPGETKLEINRRRVRERIARLNRELEEVKNQRQERRRLRQANRLPIISIIGYTNAGKSTLLNALTQSRVKAKNRLFDTLDPSSRRLRFPREREAIITDTVGFIRELPESLMEAFTATLEELTDADLLLHVVDAASPRREDQIKTVNQVLRRLNLHLVPTLVLFNKTDLLPPEERHIIGKDTAGLPISAINPHSLTRLTDLIEERIWSHPYRYPVIST